ncbi:MAG TPA: FAD-dependent oxidoreductase, partial [Coriobacteriia bacterium]
PVSLPSVFDRGLGDRKAVYREYPQAVPNAFTIAKADGTAPCKLACPAGVNAQAYVALIGQRRFKEAYDVIRERCPLPSVCGRICQHPCEAACNRGEVDDPVAIRDLKRFATDWVYSHRNEIDLDGGQQLAEKREERVAVIGGGPAGLTAAYDLTRMGYGVTIFDAMEELGGMLRSGVPAYRLPRDLLDYEIQHILRAGIEARTGVRVSDPTSLLKTRPAADSDSGATERSPLEENERARGAFDAVFVAVGAWTSRRLNLPGEDADGVWPGLRFLHEVNSGARPEVGSNVLVIGGGDVAMDVARCARRLPGVENVHLACLERREEMPAHSWEAAEALEEGVAFHNSLGPIEILAEKGKVTGVVFRACTRVFDEAGRFSPQFDDSQQTTLAADTVIVAIGQGVDATPMSPVVSGPGGRVVADPETLATNVPGVFAGGDVVLGPASLVDAMAHGHRAAEAIHDYLRGTAKREGTLVEQQDAGTRAPNPNPGAPVRPRHVMPQAPVAERLHDVREIDLGYAEEEAIAEAQRCLNCGLCSDCRLCEKVCGPGAINHDMQPETETLRVGAVIVTPGSEEVQASTRGEYGHGRYADVLSSVQFERMLSASGPTEGKVLRPSDGGPVKRIAFIQCVGSRDSARGAGYCSSVCCMSATKEALVAIEHVPGLEIAIFC